MKSFAKYGSLAVLLALSLGGLGAATDNLVFHPGTFTPGSATVAGKTVTYRAYEGLVYVQNPVDTTYQSMNIYIPTEYFAGGSINGWTASSAPIFLPNQVGGYMPGQPGKPGAGMDGTSNAILVALSKGLVVASPGARGRTNTDKAGTSYTGKAPAAIVDLKAAVRWLRYNDKVMPGNAERIVSNGTSAGGALSSLLGATGNNPDYVPYLKALGAADTRDDIFAVSAYCPISNLENADTAYEWQLNSVHETKAMGAPSGRVRPLAPATGTPANGQTLPASAPAGNAFGAPSSTSGPLTDAQIKLSDTLKSMFPAYLNSLGLKNAAESQLTLQPNGTGSFLAYIESLLLVSAQKALDSGINLGDKTWIQTKDGKVLTLDWADYIAYLGRKKAVPSFDALDLSSGENNLFGTSSVNNQHFTAFGLAHSTVKGSLVDPALVRMMNPLSYLGSKDTNSAKNWRIRHGTLDSDTSLAISAILASKLTNTSHLVDYALVWDKPHSGDYDLDELFTWVEKIAR